MESVSREQDGLSSPRETVLPKVTKSNYSAGSPCEWFEEYHSAKTPPLWCEFIKNELRP